MYLPLVPENAASGRVVWCGEDPTLRLLGPAALRIAGFEVSLARPDEVGTRGEEVWYVASPDNPLPDEVLPRVVRFDAHSTHLATLIADLSMAGRAPEALEVASA